MLTPEQSRAARGWLDWKQSDLAQKANIGLSTVRDFEKNRRNPIVNNMLAIIGAFEKAGISFQYDEKDRATGIVAGAAMQKSVEK